MTNYILFSLMFFSFTSYVAWVWITLGKQPSISHSYLLLSRKQKPLFTFFCWGTAIPAMIIGDSMWMSLAGAGMAFVGAAANISVKMTREVHTVAAASMVAFALLAISLQYHNWWVLSAWCAASALSFFTDKLYLIWWVEIATFLAVAAVLLQSII